MLPLLLLMAAAPATPSLRIVDWNIHKGRHLDGVVAALRAQDPDVCLLQEVDRAVKRTGGVDVTAEIARRLGMHHSFAPAFEELGQAAGDQPALHGQAILSKTPLRGVRILRFENQSGFWKPKPYLPQWPLLQRRLGGRIALIAEIRKNGRRMVVYNLHLESRNAAVRLAQLEEAIADTRRYPPETPVLIGGDLNSVFHPGRFRALLEGAGFSNCFGDRRVRTHVVYGALDWIFVRAAGCQAAEVIRGTGASDHDPVAARISLPEKSLLMPRHPLSSK